MSYADLFIAPVPTANRDDYATFCTQMHPYFKSLGAIEIADFWGSDVPPGELTSLPVAVKAKDDETVVMGWVTWPDKATRDAGWEKMMSEEQDMEMPFDGKRMIFGGFDQIARTTN